MTSEPDEYEAWWRKAHDAYHATLWEGQANSRRAAAILRDHVEAKLAEVRAERDDALALGDRQLDLGKQMLETLADRDRTIAELQAKLQKMTDGQ